MPDQTTDASQIVQHRLPAEGADQLILAGVNDANLQELARISGCRVVLRDDQLVLSGSLGDVERCIPIARHMIDLARLETPFAASDIRQFADSVTESEGLAPSALEVSKIILPGSRNIITPKSGGQKLYIDEIVQNEIVVGIGPAGTGKTYLAVAMAVDALHKKRVRRIVLVRPVVEAGEQLGFLPGSVEEKVDPYLRPLYDALGDMMPPDQMRRALENRTLEIAPLAYMRGRTLSDAFVILDEAQNTTTLQMKMFLTRLGLSSKAVITGDKTQIDLPRREDSGLLEVERILQGIDGISFVYLTEVDVVRHRLVKEIIKAYAKSRPNNYESRKSE
jgi:phosphate starvation-inducible PhoH-like protein